MTTSPISPISSWVRRDALARGAVVALLLISSLVGAAADPAVELRWPSSSPSVASGDFQLPVHFAATTRRGSASSEIHSRGTDVPVSFDTRGATFGIENDKRGWGVRLQYDGDAAVVAPVARGLQSKVHYFGTRAELTRGFSRVVYDDVWPGIDVRFDAHPDGRVEYSFLLERGADPDRIRLAYKGSTSLTVDSSGVLKVSTPVGKLSDAAPVAWQPIRGQNVPVDVSYELHGKNGFAFEIGRHDPSRRLIIDPTVFSYAGYLGGNNEDEVNGIAVDGQGSAYVVGGTQSSANSFPKSVGPETDKRNDFEGFIAKLTPDGSDLVYAGYFGLGNDNVATAIDVDGAGNAYVTGFESGFQNADVFVARVKPDGSGLDYLVTHGGEFDDYGNGIAVDVSGNAYVAGVTDGGSFPTMVGPDTSSNSPSDAFVSKFDPAGALVYSGFIGGDGNFEQANAIAVDSSGSAYVVGETSSPQGSFPDKGGPDRSYNDGIDGFIAKVAPDGSDLVYAGYIGGEFLDTAKGVDVDASGAAYVTGTTGSEADTFPVKAAPDRTNDGNGDAFFAKITPAGDDVVYAGYIGGTDPEDGLDIAVKSDGSPVLAGLIISGPGALPLTSAADSTREGSHDGFVAQLSPDGTSYTMVTYIGGSDIDEARAIAVDGADNIYVGGLTNSTNKFPLTAGPDLSFNGGDDGFVAKIVDQPCTVMGTPGPDTLEGTAGNDVICGEGGNDILRGGEGDDIIVGGEGKDQFFGEPGDDTLEGGPGIDTVSFAGVAGPVDVDLERSVAQGAGRDSVTVENVIGSPAADSIQGDGVNNVLKGVGGPDQIFGGDANDKVAGGGGNDTIVGDDAAQGQSGHDRLRGNGGKDVIRGSVGRDVIIGAAGRDKMYGEDDDDTIKGRDGVNREVINGGPGRDACTRDPKDRVTQCP